MKIKRYLACLVLIIAVLSTGFSNASSSFKCSNVGHLQFYTSPSVEAPSGIISAVNEFIEYRYEYLAFRTQPSSYRRIVSNKSIVARNFFEIENALLYAEMASQKTNGIECSYADYNLEANYSSIETNASKTSAEVIVSVTCNFRYRISPEINSAKGNIYILNLEKNADVWEITNRKNTTFFDSIVWEINEERTLSKANIIKERCIANAKAYADNTMGYDGSVIEQVSDTFSTAALTSSNYTYFSSSKRSAAAATARNYVAASGVSGTTYTYTYPESQYAQNGSDCTNFVSFCLNYGGGIPQDRVGTYQWYPGRSWWTNVDKFYSYLMGTKSETEKGIVASVHYSGTTYPSAIVLRSLPLASIVQFSSKPSNENDWTHSAIVTYSLESGITYVCMHSAYGWNSQCLLSEFYYDEYVYNTNSNGTGIRLIDIEGYYA